MGKQLDDARGKLQEELKAKIKAAISSQLQVVVEKNFDDMHAAFVRQHARYLKETEGMEPKPFHYSIGFGIELSPVGNSCAVEASSTVGNRLRFFSKPVEVTTEKGLFDK